MIVARMDRRLASRIDPSDVVQETLLEASQRLSDYLRKEPLPYYLWLRRLAWERLVHIQDRHIAAQKRSIGREIGGRMELSDESVMELTRMFAASGSTPSGHLLRKELRQRVRDALDSLAEPDREILVLRYVEQLKVKEVADVLGISPNAATMRQLRALERLRGYLVGFMGEDA
jgi:RNA polymerase sigma-70 factor (ECF subfamily)